MRFSSVTVRSFALVITRNVAVITEPSAAAAPFFAATIEDLRPSRSSIKDQLEACSTPSPEARHDCAL
jgi:hypothetical protein